MKDNWCNLDLIDTNCVKVVQVCGGTILESLTTGNVHDIVCSIDVKRSRSHHIKRDTHYKQSWLIRKKEKR